MLHTNESVQKCPSTEVLSHYKGLLDVEEAFCELKSYLEVRPVYHWRPDRVVNHVRLCFLAYWLSARLGAEWRGRGANKKKTRERPNLQKIRPGLVEGRARKHRAGMSGSSRRRKKTRQKKWLDAR